MKSKLNKEDAALWNKMLRYTQDGRYKVNEWDEDMLDWICRFEQLQIDKQNILNKYKEMI